ncbi:MAG: class I SAM-dependent methyltransferase [Candidatus Micrarchaeia archaeon]
MQKKENKTIFKLEKMKLSDYAKKEEHIKINEKINLIGTARIKKEIELIKKYSKEDDVIVDLGCVNNYLKKFLGRKNYIGVDITGKPDIIANVEDGLPFFKDESVDFVIAGEIIEHIVDTDFFLSEIYRILKKGGKLLLTTPNLASWTNRMRLLLGRQPQYCENRLRLGIDAGHVRCYTYSDLKKQLLEHNFKIIKFEGDLISAKFLPLKVKMMLGKFLKTFAHCFVVLCEK